MAHWAPSPIDRKQVALFSPTLDESIAADHPVRLFAETLEALDFAEWESMYVRVVGQPPIHPRVMAGCVIYGLTLGIRSSRRLQDAAANRLDFIWLLGGRVPDHATICKFRTDFAAQVKQLFRQVGRLAMDLGLIALNQVMLDGTDARANNSRYATNRRASLTEKLAALDAQVERLMAEAAQQDKSDDALFGDDGTPAKLPRALRDLKARQERLRRAMENLTEMEKDRGGGDDDDAGKPAGDGKGQADEQKPADAQRQQPATGKEIAAKRQSAKAPAIPTTDPDARVLPTKRGGFAPGYTAVLATDAAHGLVVDAQVLVGNDEASAVVPAVRNIEQSFGSKPKELAADSGLNTGENLAALAEMGVTALMPAKQAVDASAAERPDPSQPVAPGDRPRLPISPQNKVLDRSAFTYDADNDQYFCPMGRVLPRVEDKAYDHNGRKGTYGMYESVDCGGCPLAGQCLRGRSPTRRVCRDEHEPLREAMAARMKSEEGRASYKRRAPVAEGTFGVLKQVMNLRQFMLRGAEKVRTELTWAVTAFNLMKLVRLMPR